MAKQARGRGVIIETRELGGNASRNRGGAISVGKLRVEPGFRKMEFKSSALVSVGDQVEFVETPQGLAVDLVKMGRRR